MSTAVRFKERPSHNAPSWASLNQSISLQFQYHPSIYFYIFQDVFSMQAVPYKFTLCSFISTYATCPANLIRTDLSPQRYRGSSTKSTRWRVGETQRRRRLAVRKCLASCGRGTASNANRPTDRPIT